MNEKFDQINTELWLQREQELQRRALRLDVVTVLVLINITLYFHFFYTHISDELLATVLHTIIMVTLTMLIYQKLVLYEYRGVGIIGKIISIVTYPLKKYLVDMLTVEDKQQEKITITGLAASKRDILHLVFVTTYYVFVFTLCLNYPIQ